MIERDESGLIRLADPLPNPDPEDKKNPDKFNLEETIAQSTDQLDLVRLVSEKYGTYWKRTFVPKQDSYYNGVVDRIVNLVNERAGTQIDSFNFNTATVSRDMRRRESQIFGIFSLASLAMMIPTKHDDLSFKVNLDWERLPFDLMDKAERVDWTFAAFVFGAVAGLPYLATKFLLNNLYMKENIFNLEIAAKRANERFFGEIYQPTYREVRGVLRREKVNIECIDEPGVKEYTCQIDQGNGYSLFIEASRNKFWGRWQPLLDRILPYNARCWKAVDEEGEWKLVSEVVKFSYLQSQKTFEKMKRRYGQQRNL